MSFISFEFFALLTVVLSVYLLLPHRARNLLLLVASYVFYGWWDWRFLGLLLISSIVDFICGGLVDRERNPASSQSRRRLVVAASATINLGILATFKYLDFFLDSFARVAALFGISDHLPVLGIVLPVGISFYTFQTMSYTLDVYRGQLPSTRRLLDFMLYVSFFPQLVAGPIERGAHLLPQILGPRRFDWNRFSSGVQLMAVGFFKKMVIADNMAIIVNQVFREPDLGFAALMIGVYAFAFQIYGDFSGYTDIARGTARLFGFDICLNFRLPYLAVSPRDFWQRWHISLSSWLRDYLYIPLGGNRLGARRTVINLWITMLLGGLWHGAVWHFVLWGAYHAFLLSVFRRFGDRGNPIGPGDPGQLRFLLRAAGFFQLTCIGWLIFRVESVERLFAMLASCAQTPLFELGSLSGVDVLKLAVVSIGLTGFQLYQHYSERLEPWTAWPVALRVLAYLFLFYGIVLFGAPVPNDFIYFQF